MVGAGAEKVFSNIEPLIGRDFAEILRIIWPEPFASEVIELFRKTLATGKPYHSPSTIKQRRNTEEVEAYDWKIERAVLPDGRLGVVCNFYDLSERQEYEAALLASESRFRATFENAAVGIAHVAPDGSWLRVNQTLCDIVGYSKEELSRMTFQDITHPEDLQRDLDQLRRLLDEEIDDYQIHKRYIRKDHSIVWINLTVSAARPERGPLDYLIAVVEDISTEKAAVARQELLVGELNHRVKNSLATIQAMASHTMRSSADMESFKESFGGRLRAMAAAHESIFSAAELQADLATVIRKQLSPYTADSNDRLKLDGLAIPLDPDRVHGLGLIFHELATNAIKHGALSSQTGLISVAWRLETLKGRQRIHLTWTESGGPTVSPPARTGFGSMLIQTTLQDTLQGSAELKYAAEGMVARMIIPLADSAHNN